MRRDRRFQPAGSWAALEPRIAPSTLVALADDPLPEPEPSPGKDPGTSTPIVTPPIPPSGPIGPGTS